MTERRREGRPWQLGRAAPEVELAEAMRLYRERYGCNPPHMAAQAATIAGPLGGLTEYGGVDILEDASIPAGIVWLEVEP
jgi:hypothetical protein